MEDNVTPKVVVSKVNKTASMPVADVNFGKVVKSVADKWQTNNWLVLKWLTPQKFLTDATQYNAILISRLQQGSTRPQITKALKVLDKKMDNALIYVKGYIVDKYKKEEAKSYYAAFGIEYKTNKYIFPTDQNNKLIAIGLMLDGLVANGFEAKEFGTAFWQPIKIEYKNLIDSATQTDGSVSVNGGDKNMLKDSLKKGLNAILGAIKANHPDTYKQEIRDWGFQKEKY